ncbi:MBL fold metallo-hydrolase [Paenibacillus methanolicus]|uniref:Phosphoribosyl 1,2-cyclic phosphodiesterase n=1 Tax=Paenibacillus methanolicus TaxID=582686 RepID=A0A5S5BML7_9BACL|nr:MBL fold metallo-hydrolase [Paenibacillus methanolicus]TYP67400.1 phosphoribosyl 1,2-cyclic phosphodiesterase [Paenibacillus methanolicus]
MIKITPIGSSSAGNAYHVTDGQTDLLLEAGVRYKDMQRALNYKMSSIAGCLISHKHGDHVKYAPDVMRAGIDIYCSKGTADAAGLEGHRVSHIAKGKRFVVGTWAIMPFKIEHDVEEPLGFLMANQAGEKLLFATDTYYVRYRFNGLTHIMIECNYSEVIVERNIQSAPEEVRPQLVSRYRRLLQSHFSLENLKGFFQANDMSRVQEIWLLHLSDANSDEEMFKKEIQGLTGAVVHVARR